MLDLRSQDEMKNDLPTQFVRSTKFQRDKVQEDPKVYNAHSRTKKYTLTAEELQADDCTVVKRLYSS